MRRPGFVSVLATSILLLQSRGREGHSAAQAFQATKRPWGAILSMRRGSSAYVPIMRDTVTQGQTSAVAQPKVDAWALLVDAASGRKGPRNVKAPRPPEGFTKIVEHKPSGVRSSRIKASLKDAEMEKQIHRSWSHLSRELKHLQPTDRADVRLALEISLYAHRGQVRRSGAPFIEHPVEVAKILGSMCMERDTIIAGLLHDTVEDTHLTLEEIEELFGEPVRTIVEGETKVSKLAKLGSSPVDYSEIQAENLRGLFLAMTNDYRVIFVKLADRLHNIRTLEYMPALKQVKIGRETLDIYAPLADRLGLRSMKTELEDKAFAYVYPAVYQNISEQLCKRSEEYQSAYDGAKAALTTMVARYRDLPSPHNITVSGRLKGKYSLWRKMERKKAEEGRTIGLDDIQDVVALRVVITLDRRPGEAETTWKERGVRHCFRLAYLVNRTFHAPGHESAVDDYITAPKPNGYQSLHLSISWKGQVIELQIRTDWMHRVAEYGLASHWLYEDEKERKSTTANSYYRIAWMNCVKEWQNESISSKDFVDAVRREILGRRVSFFLKNGRIHDIPRGSKVIDAAFKIHRQIGMHLTLAEKNGVLASLDEEINNLDVIFIVAARNARLSPQTASIAHCEATRSKIKRYFRTEAPGVAVSEGKRLVSAFLQANRAIVGSIPTAAELEELVLTQTGYPSLDEMYIQVALTMQAQDIASMLAKVMQVPLTQRSALDLTPLKRPLYKHRAQAIVDEPVVFRAKNGKRTLRLCRQCMPVANDTLLTVPVMDAELGRVHVVHRTECAELEYNSQVAKAVDPSSWLVGDDDEFFYPSTVEVAVQKGTLYALSTAAYVLETLEAILLNASIVEDTTRGHIITFTVGVKDLSHLRRTVEGLMGMKGVNSVRRVLGSGTKPPPFDMIRTPIGASEEDASAETIVPAMGL